MFLVHDLLPISHARNDRAHLVLTYLRADARTGDDWKVAMLPEITGSAVDLA
jgi:hypothetical protein